MTRRQTRRQQSSRARRGFTLIELMISVAIVGVLSSVAIPAFQGYALRSKEAERDQLMTAFERSLLQMIAERDKFPNDMGTFSYISAQPNPPTPLSPDKRQWQPNYTDWRFVDGQPANGTYYQYYAYGYSSGSWGYFYVIAWGDLDADGQISYRERWWVKNWGGGTGSGGWEPYLPFSWQSTPGIY